MEPDQVPQSLHSTATTVSPDASPDLSSSESEPESDELNLGPGEFAHVASPSEPDPRSFQQAMERWDGQQWLEASKEEIENQMRNHTWDLVKAPQGAIVIGSGWEFRVKRKADGSVERYKARLVAKGYSQRPGFDFFETFAPTFRSASLRLILALCTKHKLHMRSVDISHAFLNGELEETVYMRQPEGFEQGGADYVCKLNKALYGLKQAARQWYRKLRSVLEALGFKQLESDPSIYLYARNGVQVIMPVFIDDITLVSADSAMLDQVVADLSSHFKLRDLGRTEFLLSIHIVQDAQSSAISLSQRQYCLDMLERFGLIDCNPVTTPMNPGTRLSASMAPKDDSERDFMADKPYRNAVGALNYLATTTRPDIAYTVGKIARFGANPGPAHWKALVHLMRYVKGTLDMKLTYCATDDAPLFFHLL